VNPAAQKSQIHTHFPKYLLSSKIQTFFNKSQVYVQFFLFPKHFLDLGNLMLNKILYLRNITNSISCTTSGNYKSFVTQVTNTFNHRI
jgi:hypothetical protein